MKSLLLALGILLYVKNYSQTSPYIVVQREDFIYAGIDNLIVIEGLNQFQKPVVTVIKGTLKKAGNQAYFINPSDDDVCKIVVGSLLDTIRHFLTIKVKLIPEPDVFLNESISSGTYKVSELKKADSLVLRRTDIGTGSSFITESFKITRLTNGSFETHINIGSSNSNVTRQMFHNAVSGDIYIIDSIFYSIGRYKQLKLSKSIVLRAE